MPRRKGVRQRQSEARVQNVRPFSLILPATELGALRMIAKQEGVSVAAVVRRAIYTVVAKDNPKLITRFLEADIDSFLQHLASAFPHVALTIPRRSALKAKLIKLLR